jgi:hypothetical protein
MTNGVATASSTNLLRRLNAERVLREVWDGEPVTASALMGATGLSRSTVLALCRELADRGHRVEPARVQWMAAAEAADGQPASLQHAEAADGLHRVLRATGDESAAWPQQGADEALVAAQQQDEEAVDHGIVGVASGCRCRRGRV